MSSIPGPVLGPCSTWITGDDVAAVCSQAAVGTDASLLDTVAVEASMALYEISGRQFPGLCSRTVRPSRDPCSCWGPSSLGVGPWFWSTNPYGLGGLWGWWSESGDQRGCNPLSIVRLAGYPVREIVEVKIDGAVLPAVDADGNPNYRLDDWRHLVRMGDPGPPYRQRFWPGCQNLDLDDTEAGTFSVSYLWGVDPPQLGRDAAAELACQLWAAANGQPCKVPAGTTKMVRSGVTIERGLLANWFDPTKSTGLVHLDLFLKAYWRTRAGRRSAIWSPDVQEFAQKVGP
jgi:hypothetical protein